MQQTQTIRSIDQRSARTNPGWLGASFRAIGRAITFFCVSFLFAVFCIAAFAGIWYLAGFFNNDSYDMMESFVVLILVSNVASRYLIWATTF